MNSGLTSDDPAISRGLKWLRQQKPTLTYEISLMIMALTTAKEGAKDSLLVFSLAQQLEKGQQRTGLDKGGWGYSNGSNAAIDRSNTQYAILGLRDAAYYGTPVDRKVWEGVRDYWENSQLSDGGWNYNRDNGRQSYGSMTVAGIASLSIAAAFLKSSEDTNPDGTPICCQPPEPNEALERA
ncbi:MAG TPA: hypothetical protein DD473_08725, partial [Planctomycetaceae bacterium]|nr:hypothetical protein [Planctomycetaceae bacterium]